MYSKKNLFKFIFMFSNTKKHNMLNFLQIPFEEEVNVNKSRIFFQNGQKFFNKKIAYLVTREFRLHDNFAYNFARENSTHLTMLILVPFYMNKTKNEFFQKQFYFYEQELKRHKISYIIFDNIKKLKFFLRKQNIELLVVDFNPILNEKFVNFNFSIVEIDGHNICPARVISEKQEYNAATFRPKVYKMISEFLTEYPFVEHKLTPAEQKLQFFVKNILKDYADKKNNPLFNATSNLSPYLNLGFISAQRVALEIIKSEVSDYNKENFLEELIVRKELSDNFCFYNKKYKTLEGIPQWAKTTLNSHIFDPRPIIYSIEQLEQGNTQDGLWNAAQKQLLREGTIHGYMRMYWAKKFLEWTKTPKDALNYAIYLNDKYAYDAPSTNGYVGILWTIGGLHDRAFQERPIIGKIRPMTYNGTKSKFNITEYIKKYN